MMRAGQFEATSRRTASPKFRCSSSLSSARRRFATSSSCTYSSLLRVTLNW